jgi:hypothetical protein
MTSNREAVSRKNSFDVQVQKQPSEEETTRSNLGYISLPNSHHHSYVEDIKTISEIFDRGIFDTISSVEHILRTEQELEDMKLKIEDKKRLQKERNVLTAQLSRDRKKIEVELLHNKCYELTQLVNRVRNTVSKAQVPIELQSQLSYLFDDEELYR